MILALNSSSNESSFRKLKFVSGRIEKMHFFRKPELLKKHDLENTTRAIDSHYLGPLLLTRVYYNPSTDK